MSQASTLRLCQSAVDRHFWPTLARQVSHWLHERSLPAAGSVVLLPFVELVPLAREAFAAQGGWQPRVETTRTLASALGPPRVRPAGAVTGDRPTDLLVAAALLRAQPWAVAWARRDVRAFDQACAAVVDAAHVLLRAASARPPAQRDAWWTLARERLAPLAGPGQTERALARVALEWAALDDPAETDILWRWQPSAWVVVQAGGCDPLADALITTAGAPVLQLETDPPPGAVFGTLATLPPPRRLVCDGFEDEAHAAATQILLALEQGHAPVALIALDRALVRRVHALLGRTAGLRVDDETGWRLSTTRAAARVMAALRAAPAGATRDAWLDWLKNDATMPPALLSGLEAAWRGDATLPPDIAAAWMQQRARLAVLGEAGRLPLDLWVRRLGAVLGTTGDDPAAQQVALALRLDAEGAAAWAQAAGDLRLDLAGFTRWVDDVLDGAVFRPPSPADPHVVITPLQRALLRPFGAVVCPGADDSRLGAPVEPQALIGEAVAAALGLPTAGERRMREALAFAQLLRVERLVLLRRRSDGGEPLGESPLVERMVRARERAGVSVADEVPAVPGQAEVRREPVSRPAPAVTDGLPQRLSASALQALRECPYRFFARVLLRLSESDELDVEPDKRDYGSWLHDVLLRFHRDRAVPRPAGDDLAALRRTADTVQADHAPDDAPWVPFRAAFETFAPRYVAWLQQRDAEGWCWQAGEVDGERAPDQRLPVRLVGRIDRIDRAAGEDGTTRQLIDYKTGSVDELRRTVRRPLEDTQLAVYAALAGGGDDRSRRLRAMYLALDDRAAPVEVEHVDVAATATAFVEGLAGDWRELRDGVGLAALGEGPVCDRCEVRGLCRRDHWSGGGGVVPAAGEGAR